MGLILGIDPGAATGVASYQGGKLVELLTIEPFQLERFLRERTGSAPCVMFEDSRLETRLWNARQKGAYGAALATARSVGQIDAWCTLIASLCADLGIPAHGVSPTVKGAKVAAPAFGRITGWTKRCNQHERDAAMVAWKFRNSVALKGRTC